MSAAQRYFPRSPRYVFRIDDQTIMRYAAMETRGIAHSTQILNLSESGLLFTMKDGEAPEEGDVLKIEFTVPGRKQIACFATVVRVDQAEQWNPEYGESRSVVVGLQFRNLPEGHRRALKVGLQGKTTSEENLGSETFTREAFAKETFGWDEARQRQITAFAGLSLAMVAVMMILVAPPAKWLAFCKTMLLLTA